ncbi:MAG: OmpA family protein [Bacteroidia bacterium]|nr:OmpA family protein [Bacteroidia bacterium]
MRKTVLLFLTGLLSLGTIFAQNTASTTVLFDHDQFQLNPAAQSELLRFLQANQSVTFQKLKISGHTDGNGSAEYNQKLSEKRAETVAAFLRENGVQNLEVTVNARGESLPVASNDSELGRQTNRRVEITAELAPAETPVSQEITHFSGGATQEPEPAPVVWVAALEEGNTLDLTQTTVLYSPWGMEVKVSCDFKKAPEARNLSPTIRFKDYSNFEVAAEAGVSTQNHSFGLISQGAICIEGVMNGGTLKELPQGMTIEVSIPASSYVPGMSLWIAQNQEDAGKLNWTPCKSDSLRYDVETKAYIFTVPNARGCYNVDKKADTTMLVRVTQRMLREGDLFGQYLQNGTFSQARKFKKRYYALPKQIMGEEIRLVGNFRIRGRNWKVDRTLIAGSKGRRRIRINRKNYYLLTDWRKLGMKKELAVY